LYELKIHIEEYEMLLKKHLSQMKTKRLLLIEPSSGRISKIYNQRVRTLNLMQRHSDLFMVYLTTPSIA
jgi:hypothetical protein